jgi:hypothetical protein
MRERTRQCVNELVVSIPVDDDPSERGAHLAAECTLSTREGGGSLAQIHVVEDDGSRLPTQLQGAAGNALAAD